MSSSSLNFERSVSNFTDSAEFNGCDFWFEGTEDPLAQPSHLYIRFWCILLLNIQKPNLFFPHKSLYQSLA